MYRYITALRLLLAVLACALPAAGGQQRPAPAAMLGVAFRPEPMCCNPPPRPFVGVLPLGDSITVGLSSGTGTGYRGPLDQFLSSTRHLWLGSQGTAPLRHEGHSGWTIDQLAQQTHDWVAATHPAIVLLDAGTNDDGQGRTADQMLASMSSLLDIILDAGAGRVIVAQITLTPLNSAWQQQQEADFDNALPALAATKRDVHVVDMRGVHISTDRVHPDDQGYQDMAGRWLAALPPVRAA